MCPLILCQTPLSSTLVPSSKFSAPPVKSPSRRTHARLRNRGSGTPLKPTRRRNRNTALCAVFRAGPAAGTQHKVLCSGTLRCCYIARCDSLARLRWSTWQLRCCTPVGTNPSESKLQPIGKAIPTDNVVSRDQRMTGDTVSQDSSKDQHTLRSQFMHRGH